MNHFILVLRINPFEALFAYLPGKAKKAQKEEQGFQSWWIWLAEKAPKACVQGGGWQQYCGFWSTRGCIAVPWPLVRQTQEREDTSKTKRPCQPIPACMSCMLAWESLFSSYCGCSHSFRNWTKHIEVSKNYVMICDTATQMRNGGNERWALACQDHGAKARLARLQKEKAWAESNIFQEPCKVWGPKCKKGKCFFNSWSVQFNWSIMSCPLIYILKSPMSPSVMRPPSHQEHLGCSGDLKNVAMETK